MESFPEKPTSFSSLIKYVTYLEERIKRLEEHLALEPLIQKDVTPETIEQSAKPEKNKDMEFQIGEFWFAKVGVVILAIGVVFVLTLPYSGLPAYVPGVFGFLITAGITGLYYLLKKTYVLISRYLLGSSLLLLYFSTLRLHFFSDQPALNNTPMLLTLLVFVVIFNLFISIKRDSVYLTAVTITLGYITAIVSNDPAFIFIMIALLSTIVVYLRLKKQWKHLILYGIFLTYFTHLIWFINNPIMGQEFQLVKTPEYSLYFLLLYFIIFAISHLLRPQDDAEDNLLILSTILNCTASYFLFLGISLVMSSESILKFHLIGSIIFLVMSYIFWIKVKSKYSSFFYSLFGFAALSVAIIAGFDKPDFFILLCWQSLLVVALALLYRSKIIVIANFFIFLSIFLAYLVATKSVGGISISFGIVALLSARILNWQKTRLEIQTESVRNAYLGIAFLVFPYALHQMVPGWYVSITWTGLAIFYYLLSVLLKANKYRWLALFTLILSVLYVLVIGIRQPDPVYKIISFVSLGIILLLVSIFYSRNKAKRDNKQK